MEGSEFAMAGPGQDVLDGGPGSNVVIQSATIARMAANPGALMVQAMASSFVPAGAGAGAPPIADPSTQQPLLAQPHA